MKCNVFFTFQCNKMPLFVTDVLDETTDENGRTGLMWAAAKGKAQVIQVMCRHGADPNFKV
jgi:ankyrin repeat protein